MRVKQHKIVLSVNELMLFSLTSLRSSVSQTELTGPPNKIPHWSQRVNNDFNQLVNSQIHLVNA